MKLMTVNFRRVLLQTECIVATQETDNYQPDFLYQLIHIDRYLDIIRAFIIKQSYDHIIFTLLFRNRTKAVAIRKMAETTKVQTFNFLDSAYIT